MNYQKKYQKYKNKYLKLGGTLALNKEIINLVYTWWEAVRLKNEEVLKKLISPGLQIINYNNRVIGDNILEVVKKYHIGKNYKLYDFKITRDNCNNTIVSYLVNNESETTIGNKTIDKVLHSLVINSDNRVISWNNFSYK